LRKNFPRSVVAASPAAGPGHAATCTSAATAAPASASTSQVAKRRAAAALGSALTTTNTMPSVSRLFSARMLSRGHSETSAATALHTANVTIGSSNGQRSGPSTPARRASSTHTKSTVNAISASEIDTAIPITSAATSTTRATSNPRR
jgi:hypothetical protein